MNAYENFSEYYDLLTGDVDYPGRTDYLCALFRRHDRLPSLLLDMACGTGGFSLEFAARGMEVIGVDPSVSMLSLARDKADRANLPVLFLCQPAGELDLYGTVDGAVCCLDSISHIIDYEELCRSFSRISLFLEPGRLFLFDVNTPYKHREILGNNSFVYDLDEVFCVWQNRLCENDIVDIQLDFFCPDGERYLRKTDCFSERAYSEKQLETALSQAGFRLEAVYGDLTEEAPGPDSERNIYVARKYNM